MKVFQLDYKLSQYVNNGKQAYDATECSSTS